MSGPSASTASSGKQAALDAFLNDDESLDYSTVGAEDRMGDADALKYWQGMYRILGVSSDSDKVAFRKKIYMWVCKNSTSTRSDFRSHLEFGGKRIRMNRLIGGNVVDEENFRRFIRAEKVVSELERIARHKDTEPVLIEKAKRKGIRTSAYIAAVDVAEYFDLTGAERAEVARVKAGTLPYSAPMNPPKVVREATATGVAATTPSASSGEKNLFDRNS